MDNLSEFERSLRPERFKKFDTWYMNYKKKTLRLPCFEDVWEAVEYFKVKDKFWRGDADVQQRR